MISYQKYFSVCTLALLTQAAFAQSAPTLGTASGYAALGGAGVTCTSPFAPLPALSVTGDVGSLLAAPTSVTGFPGFTPGALPCSLSGNIHVGDAAAVQAYNSFALAYADLAALPCPADADHNLVGDLIGKTLSPGIYCISGVGLLTGQLTLNGPSNGIWIFKAASSLTPIGGEVVMAGGGQACNVYWQLGTAASLDATKFVGTILAGSAVTFTGVGSSLVGRALAKTNVTMTGANITDTCAAQPGPGPVAHSCSDRVTGGGYINAGHAKANFGVTGGIRKDAFRGHLSYIDHGTGLKLKGTGVTSYVVVDATTRRIEGTASIDGVAGTYKVVVSDNGEPGRNDRFAITLSNGYSASGTLAGGNIQLHERHCGKGHKGHDGRDQDDDDDDHDDNDRDRGDHDKKHGDTKKPYGDDKKRN